MPLFRQLEVRPEQHREKPKRKPRKREWDEGVEDELLSLRHLCLISLVENMKDVWTQDYAQNYMDQYFFRYIMGPFSLLPGDVIEELTSVLSQRNLLSRAALHLLLLPQLRSLTLARSSNLVTANLCHLVAVRCQSLKSLDLSGAINVSSAALCSLLRDLSCLSSLSLAGTLCDRAVIATVARQCPGLQYLDVSRCHHLSPSALLPLGRPESGRGMTRLGSLLALDIGLEETEGDESAVAAFLMLGVPSLRRLALEGAGEACVLIESKNFVLTEGFTCREGVPGLRELWDERVAGKAGAETLEEETDDSLNEEEDQCLRLDALSVHEANVEGCRNEKEEPGKGFKLHLRDLQGATLTGLDAVSKLCPDLSSLSLNCHDEHEDEDDLNSTRSTLLTQGLSRWAGRLHSLSLQFPGPLSDLVPALEISGSSLLSLTLEGVRADGNLPFLAFIRACPRLTALVIHIDPPRSNQEDDDDDDVEDWSLPCLPDLRTLALNFSLDERQLKPVLCWTSLKGALWSLLKRAQHLHTLSLVAAPCRLDPVFRLVLDRQTEPLRRLRHVSLKRSDVTMETAARLVDACFHLRTLDVSGCWSLSLSNINKLQSRARRRRHKLQITWT